jgi:hypothetical protein
MSYLSIIQRAHSQNAQRTTPHHALETALEQITEGNYNAALYHIIAAARDAGLDERGVEQWLTLPVKDEDLLQAERMLVVKRIVQCYYKPVPTRFSLAFRALRAWMQVSV